MNRVTLRLCALHELADGDSRGFDPLEKGHDTMLVVRQHRRVFAWRDSCPHIDGAPMAWRKDAYLNAARDRIVCHAHGAQFDIVSGACTLGPCLGQSLRALRAYVGNDGGVYVDLDPDE